ncbi:MucBP domain-containing protein, partial [Enterococcus gilvus]
MKNKRTLIYQQEKLSKYKMHKVKKNWVIKSSVTGVMVMATIASPLTNHFVYASEVNMEESDKEQSKKKVKRADFSTNENKKQLDNAQKKQGISDSKTWISGVNDEISLKSFKRITDTGGIAPSQYSGTNITDNNINLDFSIDNTNNKISVGDKIIIPITTTGKTLLFTHLSSEIPELGNIKYTSGIGFEITVTKEPKDLKKFQIEVFGPTSTQFELVYSGSMLVAKEEKVFLNGQLIETISSTYNSNFISYANTAYSGVLASGSSKTYTSYNFQAPNLTEQKILGKAIEPIDESLVQIERIKFDKSSTIIDYTGKNKEDLDGWINLFIPSPDGSGKQAYSTSIFTGNTFKYVDVPSDATNEQIINQLQTYGEDVYTVIQNTDGSYTMARNVVRGENGFKLTDTTEYKESGANSPVEFFEKTFGIKYSNDEVIKKINDAFYTTVQSSRLGHEFTFSDNSISHESTMNYFDSVGNSYDYQTKSTPDKVATIGTSRVKVKYVDSSGKQVKPDTDKTGFPTTEDSPEKAQITMEDLIIKGYSLDTTKLPEGADINTGALNVDFPSEGETKEVTYIFTPKSISVDVKYMFDKNNDGVGDELLDQTQVTGIFGKTYFSIAKDYRDKNYILSKRPENYRGTFDEPTPEIIYIYQEVGNLIIDTTDFDNNSTGSTTKYSINNDYLTITDLEVPVPPKGYHYESEDGETLTPEDLIQPKRATEDTVWKLVASSSQVTYRYVDKDGKEIAPDKVETAKTGS